MPNVKFNILTLDILLGIRNFFYRLKLTVVSKLWLAE